MLSSTTASILILTGSYESSSSYSLLLSGSEDSSSETVTVYGSMLVTDLLTSP